MTIPDPATGIAAPEEIMPASAYSPGESVAALLHRPGKVLGVAVIEGSGIA